MISHKNEIFGYWQPIEYPELHIRNTYLNILITSKFYILARLPESSCSNLNEKGCGGVVCSKNPYFHSIF
jgi:hypothetical protein